jgi:hypothetical protein
MLVTLLASVPVAVAADSNKVIYSETFKKGATRITEQTLDVALTPTASPVTPCVSCPTSPPVTQGL